MIRCPCCNCLTINDVDLDGAICKVCFWQYDDASQAYPDIAIGPNHVSLNEARMNYKEFKASEYRFIDYVRAPRDDEI